MIPKEELIQIAGAENVFEDIRTLEAYACDQSYVSSGMPRCVIKPANTKQVQEIVRQANKHDEPLIPVSSPGGPRFRGDTIPSQGGVIVDLSRMNRILHIDFLDRVAMVEPGVTFPQLEAALRAKGLRALKPLLPRASKSVLASCLEREPIVVPREHWDTVDPLICVEVVFGTGDTFRTGSAAGPHTVEEQQKAGRKQITDFGPAYVNLNRVLQGAQGTMGIVTWATVVCGILPVMEKSFFVAAQRPESLIDLIYQLTRRRMGEALFILNGFALAGILGNGPAEIKKFASALPPWVLFFNLTALDYLPEEKMAYQEKDVSDLAQAAGLELLPSIEGVSGRAFMKILNNPPEPYYKMKYKGGCQDIFFATTLDKTPFFIDEVTKEMKTCRYPASEMGVYLQPTVQGCSCHCEFSFPCDSSDAAEKGRLRTLLTDGARRLAYSGAYFTRPYGPWADFAYQIDGSAASALRKVKGILDPRGIMNPGRLCY